MSSTASVIFLVFGLFGDLTQGFQRRYWLGASVACYAVASFMAWFRIRPDLSIEVQSVSTQPDSFIWSDLEQLKSLVVIKLFLVNTRPANTAIKHYGFVMKTKEKEFVGEHFSLHGYGLRGVYDTLTDLGSLRHGRLEQGEPLQGYLCFAVHCDPRGKKAIFSVTDAYKVTQYFRLRIPSESEEQLYRELPANAFRDLL